MRPSSSFRAPPDDTLLWGVHPVLAALANPRRRVERVLATRNAAARLPKIGPSVPIELLELEEIDQRLPPGAVHQGLALRASPLEPMHLHEACDPPDGRPVLLLDGVTDPQNVGAVFRSAAAFGARAVIMQDRKAPPFTGALAKAAAGAIELVPRVDVVNLSRTLEALTEMGYLTVGLEGEATMALAAAMDDPRPTAIAIGAEGKGLRDLVAAHCERRARIQISGAVESLNVAAATAIALYAATAGR